VREAAVLAALAASLLVADAAVARPWAWLGVRIRDLSEQEMEEISGLHGMREGFGVMIVEVLEGTAAARAGLQSGDVVVAFEGRPVTETRLLQRLIAAAGTEREYRLTVLRREGRHQVRVRLTTMPRDVAGDRVAAEFGFALRSSPGPEGAAADASSAPTVAAVLPRSPAERAGLQVGDVLLQVGDRAVVGRDAAREALADAPVDRPLRLALRRGEERLTVVLPAP
jgi:serine protease Do